MTATVTEDLVGALQRIPLEELHENPLNPRKHYDPEALKQLADNIAEVGQITPVTVRPRAGGGYELLAGHRRARAAKLAGLSHLEAKVREDLDDRQAIEILNIENLQRDDLHALEEAQGFKTLMTEAGYDVPRIAARVGRSVKYVYDRIKLLQLTPDAQKRFLAGEFEAGHAIILARLSPADQKRALEGGVDGHGNRPGGLFEAEVIYDDQEDLELEDEPQKAVSVREFQGWVNRNVRFRPDQIKQEDLAFDYPETAKALAEVAAMRRGRMLPITTEYLVPDPARDEKERTIGSAHWKRADGQLDREGEKTKRCEHARWGLIVAGPGRGDALLVCVDKKKCDVHWKRERQENERRARDMARHRNGASGESPKKPEPNTIPGELRSQWEREEIEARAPKIAQAVKAIVADIKLPDEIAWNLAQWIDWNGGGDSWGKVGSKRQWGGEGTRHDELVAECLTKVLPGKRGDDLRSFRDASGARSFLAFQVWLARDAEKLDLDAEIEEAIESRWKAHRAAEQKAKPAKAEKNAKPEKKLAGDVRRARAAKKRRAA